MRISTSYMAQQSVNTMLEGQSNMADLQNRINSGKRITQPSDDPVGATRALELTHMTADVAQYQRNITTANARLGLEDSALSASTDALTRVRTLVLQGINGTQTDDTRADIAAELTQIRQQLMGLANGKDAAGDFLFAGNQVGSQPFSVQSGNVVYTGDNGQRMIAAGPGMQVATGDSGASVFMNVPTGNGTFQAVASTANTGSGVLGTLSVNDRSQWDGGNYSIVFTAPDTYEVRDAGNNVVDSGTYTDNGSAVVSFKGVQVALSGTPAAGDSFDVAPSGTQDIFTTLGNIISALKMPGGGPAMQNALNAQFSNLDQGMDLITQTRSAIGGRMNALDQQASLNSDLSLQYQTALSDVQDLDYYDAISQLNLQSTALQAAQMTYTKVHSSSLFDYLR